MDIDEEPNRIVNAYDTFLFMQKSCNYTDGYAEISKDNEEFIGTKEVTIKEYYLEKLVFDSILIRDFVNTYRYIQLYLDLSYNRCEDFQKLKDELDQLFDRIR